MTAHSAQKDQQIEELQAQLRTQRLSSTHKVVVVTVTVVVAVTVVVEEDPGVVEVGDEDPTAAVVPGVDEELEAKADAEATVHETAPRTQNYIQVQTITAGHVVLMSPKSMIVIPVAINCRDTKIQQPALKQKE
jgi:hypothetical protein